MTSNKHKQWYTRDHQMSPFQLWAERSGMRVNGMNESDSWWKWKAISSFHWMWMCFRFIESVIETVRYSCFVILTANTLSVVYVHIYVITARNEESNHSHHSLSGSCGIHSDVRIWFYQCGRFNLHVKRKSPHQMLNILRLSFYMFQMNRIPIPTVRRHCHRHGGVGVATITQILI